MRPRPLRAAGPAAASLALAAAVVAVSLQLGSLANGFALDDVGVITEHPVLRDWSGLWRAFAAPWWPDGGGQYRPVVLSLFTLEWQLGGGAPWLFHVGNLLWHGLCAGLMVLLIRPWLSVAGTMAAGLVFALHPVHVEAVANIVGRAELVAAAGVLGALLLHRRRSWWAVPVFALGLGGKEHAVVFLALAPLVDLLDGRRPLAPWHPEVRARTLAYLAVVACWALAVFLLFGGSPVTAPHLLWQVSTAAERWLTMLAVVPEWLRLAVWPWTLAIDYGPQVVLPWPDQRTRTLLGGVVLLGLTGLVMRAARRDRLWWGVGGWSVIAIAPVANLLLPTGIVAAERVLYLPSVALALAAGIVVERGLRARPAAAVTLLALWCTLFATRTLLRVGDWASSRTVLSVGVLEQPRSSHLRASLAQVLHRAGDTAGARRQIAEAVALFERSPALWLEAVRLAELAGDLARADSVSALALARFPGEYALVLARGGVALTRQDTAAAGEVLTLALRQWPDSLPVRVQWIGWQLQRGDAEAADQARRALPPGTAARRFVDSLVAAGGGPSGAGR